MLICILFLILLHACYTIGYSYIEGMNTRAFTTKQLKLSKIDLDDEESFRKIAEVYLTNKFESCDRPAGCRFACNRDEAKSILKEILPPVTLKELETEVDNVMDSMKNKESKDIQEIDFVRAVLSNSYWSDAGPLVVKELIFLDCLNSNYYKKVKLLEDDVYDELKESLTWEGSVVSNLKANEARFIYAVAAYRRGESLLHDDEYTKLKNDLISQKSWIVNRVMDPLEKLGMNTFMGYLHRQMAQS